MTTAERGELGSCIECGLPLVAGQFTSIASMRPRLVEHVRAALAGRDIPDDAHLCRACATRHRRDSALADLERERGELSAIEREVARKIADRETVARSIEVAVERSATFGSRVADDVARVGGSWPFVIGFVGLLIVWICVNLVVLRDRAFDPYPFILLNLVLSCIAALQAPIIMMSQNRAAARDRFQADQDYRVNLKAELEVAALHEKVDHLLHERWESLVDMQQAQIDLLEDVLRRGAARDDGDGPGESAPAGAPAPPPERPGVRDEG